MTWEDHMSLQEVCREELIEIGREDFLGLGEFFFLADMDCCFTHFVRTKSKSPDLVYQLFEDTVRSTGESFSEHIAALVQNTAAYMSRVRQFGTPENIAARQGHLFATKESNEHWLGIKRMKFQGDMLRKKNE